MMLLAATGVLLGGCASAQPSSSVGTAPPHQVGTPEAAESTVRDWLIDMAGREGDLGWGRLDRQSQISLFGSDASAYHEEAIVVGDILRWQLEVGMTTWDGRYLVGLTLTEGHAAVDQFAHGRLIRRLTAEGLPNRAVVAVRMVTATEGVVVGQ